MSGPHAVFTDRFNSFVDSEGRDHGRLSGGSGQGPRRVLSRGHDRDRAERLPIAHARPAVYGGGNRGYDGEGADPTMNRPAAPHGCSGAARMILGSMFCSSGSGLKQSGRRLCSNAGSLFGAPDRFDGVAWLPPRRPNNSVGRGAGLTGRTSWSDGCTSGSTGRAPGRPERAPGRGVGPVASYPAGGPRYRSLFRLSRRGAAKVGVRGT